MGQVKQIKNAVNRLPSVTPKKRRRLLLAISNMRERLSVWDVDLSFLSGIRGLFSGDELADRRAKKNVPKRERKYW